MCISLFLSLTPLAYAEDATYNCGRFFSGPPGTSRPTEFDYNLPYQRTLDINGQKYSIPFEGYMANVTANTDNHSIAFDAQPNGSSLAIRLSRTLIDSKQDNRDVPFTVIVNGQVGSNTTEAVVPSSGDRMVCIPLPTTNSPSKVEIIGTTIAPEFGSLALVIVSTTMAGLIAFRAIYGNHPKM